MATYIETALVSSAGKLLIQLDDGTVIDAGYVRGGQGPAGRDGADGSPGIPGAKGDPGENGAKWHTGVGAPEIGLGDAGDLYMDVANALAADLSKGRWELDVPCQLKVTCGWWWWRWVQQQVVVAASSSTPVRNPQSSDNDGKPIQDGDLWVDINGNILYVYYDGVWSEVTACGTGTLDEKKFVKRSGDSMYGDLLFKDDEETDDADYLLSIRTNNTYNPRQRTFYGDYTEFKVENALYFGPKTDTSNLAFEVWAARSNGRGGHYFEVTGNEVWSGSYNTSNNFNSYLSHASDGSFLFRSERNGSGGFFVDVFGKGTHNDYISFYADTSIRLNTDSGYTLKLDDDNGLTYNATIGDTDDAKTVTNKEYVDTRDGILQNEIIELAEEINALSPVLERGLFISTAGATGPGEGEFFIRNASGKTIDYTDPTVTNIIISKKDKDDGDHFFTDVEVGDLLHLFEEGPDNGLYEITSIAGNSSPTDPAVAVTFNVNLISGFGEATVGDVARLRISKPPSGGDASTFLSKYGERVIDATAPCNYEWNESVSIKSAGSIDVEPARDNGVTITTQNGSSQDVEVFTISNPVNTKFSVNSNGTISADATKVFIAQEDHHLTTKKFVDDKFDFSQYQELS